MQTVHARTRNGDWLRREHCRDGWNFATASDGACPLFSAGPPKEDVPLRVRLEGEPVPRPMRLESCLVLISVFIFAAGVTHSSGSAEVHKTVPPSRGHGVLIDAIHANDFSTIGLKPGIFEYHHIIGHRIAMEYLRSRGVRCDRATEGRLDGQRLAPYRLLFIPLVSGERPPLLVPEISAIRSFVASGGSLFVVTDHTNVYFHSHLLQPLFTELDIASFTDTACDDEPQKLGQGAGWIGIMRFTPHPVTSGLKCIAFQTGGCVDPRFAVALTSARSWADAWKTGIFGKENAPGFYGNFQRDPGEKAGPLGVVLAKTFGSGRIVVIGDQNMLSDTFINYADNYRLWLNATAWLLGQDALREPGPYDLWRKPRVLVYERYGRAAVGVSESSGCYHVWALLSRHYWAFANDRVSVPSNLIVFPYNDSPLPAEHAAAVAAHLRRGKNVLILNAEGATLMEEPSVIAQILAAAGVKEPTRRACPGKLVLELPASGAIHVLGPDLVFDNGTVADPTRAPTTAEEQRNQMILEAVREAIGSPRSLPKSRISQ
jgi:hypothetical protein